MKKKGFTLIELISVIVVLGVLAIIAVPMVVNQIDDTKKETYRASIRSVFDSVTTYLAKNPTIEDIPSTGVLVPEGEIYKRLNLKNQIFVSGLIYRDEDGVMKVQNLSDGTYCASGSKNDLRVVSGDCDKLDITEPEINIYASRITTDSITIVVNSSDNESGITSFKYSLNGKFIEETKNNVYTYKNLKADTKYHIEVKSINGNNQEATAAVDISTKSGNIVYKVVPEGYSRSKTLTIIYPAQKENMIYEYQVIGKTDWVTVEGNTVDILVEENTTVNARVVQNGIEIIQLTKSFYSIDKDAPTIDSIDYNIDGWAISKPVTIKATDLKSGIASEGYSFDGGNTWQSSPTKVLTENTVLNIVVKDVVGNISPIKTIIVGEIDSTIPQSHQITATAGGQNYASGSWTGKNVELKANPKPVAPSGYKYQWYKKNGSSYVAIEGATNQTYVVSIDDQSTYKVDVQTNAGSAVVSSSTYDVKVDKTSPNVGLNGLSLTTNSAKVTFTATDNGVGLNNKTCAYGTSTTYGSTGTISGNTCTLSNLKTGTTYYYQVCATDKVGNIKCMSGSTSPKTIENPSIEYTNTPTTIQNGYLKQQTAHVKYVATGITNPRYFVKTTKEGVSNIAVINSCENINNLPANCKSTSVGTKLAANTWYEVSGDLSITYTEAIASNEKVYATTYDGTNFSQNISGTLAKIDLTSPTVTLGTATTTGNSITIPYTLTDSESGIGSYTCSYADTPSTISVSSANFTSSDSKSLTSCTLSGLKDYKKYYYKICATDKVGNSTTCQTGEATTKDVTGPSKPTVILKINTSEGSTYNSGSWTNKNVYHIVTSSDSGSGIAYYQYSHDGKTNWTKLDWSSTIYNDNKSKIEYLINWAGNWNFYVRAVDNAGNVSSNSNVFTVKIDKTGPSLSGLTNASNGQWINKAFEVSYNASDEANGSGIAYCQYKYNYDVLGTCNNSWCKENNTVSNGVLKTSFSYPREAIAYFRCIDNAGNVSNTLSTTIKIDTTKPTVTFDYSSFNSKCTKNSSGIYECTGSTPTLKSSCSDSGGSGVSQFTSKDVQWECDTKTNYTGDTISINICSPIYPDKGVNYRTVQSTCVDKAGNETKIVSANMIRKRSGAYNCMYTNPTTGKTCGDTGSGSTVSSSTADTDAGDWKHETVYLSIYHYNSIKDSRETCSLGYRVRYSGCSGLLTESVCGNNPEGKCYRCTRSTKADSACK